MNSRIAVPRRTPLLGFAVVGCALVLALLAGALAGLGSLLLLVLPVAVIGAGLVLASPVPLLVGGAAVVSLLVVGPAIYFAQIESARWIVPAVCVAITLPMLSRVLGNDSRQGRHGLWPSGCWLLALFLLFSAVSTAINRADPGDWTAFLRLYVLVLPLVVLAAVGGLDERHWKYLWFFYVFASLAQLPVALTQQLVFASRQVRSADWDAVVGTFPGQAEGGGASAAMGVYLVVAVVFALMLARHGQLRWRWAALVTGCALVTIAVAEVKAVVLLIGLAVLLVFVDQIRRRPGWFVAALVGASLAITGLMAVYTRIHYEDRVVMGRLDAPRTPLEAIQNQLDPSRASIYTGELSRAAALGHWWDVNVGRGHWRDALLGHGAGATQFSRFNVGELVGRYRHALNQTSASVLLWEVGLIGFALLGAGLLTLAATAVRLAGRLHDRPLHQALLRAAGLSLLLFTLTLPYKSFIFGTAPSQVLLALLLGYVAHAHRLWGTSATVADQRLTALRRASVAWR